MKSYARIDGGVYVELIAPMAYDGESPEWIEGEPSRIGDDIPIDLRFTPEFISWLVDITDIVPPPQVGWTYIGGVFSAAQPPGSSLAELSASVRTERDRQLASVYDPGIAMALRALRMADTPQKTVYAESKIIELDLYAEALAGIPEQVGFPASINWPTVPVK